MYIGNLRYLWCRSKIIIGMDRFVIIYWIVCKEYEMRTDDVRNDMSHINDVALLDRNCFNIYSYS